MKQKQKNAMGDFEIEFSLLYELMMWFKTEFFTWMDNPKCKKCSDSTVVFKGLSSHPTNFINTDRVEVMTFMKEFELLYDESVIIYAGVVFLIIIVKSRTDYYLRY